MKPSHRPYKYTGGYHRLLKKENRRLKLLVASQASPAQPRFEHNSKETQSIPHFKDSPISARIHITTQSPTTSANTNHPVPPPEEGTRSYEESDDSYEDDEGTTTIRSDEESDNSYEDTLGVQYLFVDELKKWMLRNRITHTAATELLKLLGKFNALGLRLPADSRTFLSTPKTVEILPMGKGQFYYKGLETCLRETFANLEQSITARLVFNMDGMPLNNSSKNEIWPILCSVDGMPEYKVMVVAIYLGDSKPDIDLYLEAFVSELCDILSSGVEVKPHVLLTILPPYFICDSPARCHFKG